MNQDETLESKGLFRDIANLKKLWPYATENRSLLFTAVALIPLISAMQVYQPIILKNAIDSGIIHGDTSKLNTYCIMFFFLVVGEYAFRTGQSYTTALVVNKMVLRLRKKLVSHVLGLKASYHDNSLSGALVTRATSDFDNLSESLSMGVLRSIVDLAALIGCMIGMLVLQWQLALVSIVVLPLLFWGIGWFSKILKTLMHLARSKLSSLNAFTQECLYGNSTIKILAARENAYGKYQEMNGNYRDAQMKVVVLDSMIYSALDGIASIMIGVTLWVAVSEIFGLDIISAGIMVAFVRYVHQLFEPLKQLGSTMAMLQGVFTAVDRIFGLLETDAAMSEGRNSFSVKGDVEFRNVSFGYEVHTAKKNLKENISKPLIKDNESVAATRKSRLILNDVSFSLESGQSLALVGPTGSGKSTIIKLLSKLYDGYTGDISIGGQELRNIDGALLRSQISIVPQDIVLFDGSVAFNIGLGFDSISLEDIKEAAEVVGADDFIMKLSGGYDFMIKEQGGNLSHGQTQLIAFARAIARKPKLVILDEATSSVDPHAENQIQTAIAKILVGRSVVVIAHRLSTVRECDKIIVIGGGKILEEGNHEELMGKGGVYRKLNLGSS